MIVIPTTNAMASRPSKKAHVDGLLRVAADFCSARGAGYVQDAARRRAVSTACYAVFHCLCTIRADGLVGWGRHDPIADVYRGLDHAGGRKKLLGSAAAAVHPDLAKVGALFEMLQERRHSADYAPPFIAVTRGEALASVAQAHEAVTMLGTLAARERTKLAVLLLIARRPA